MVEAICSVITWILFFKGFIWFCLFTRNILKGGVPCHTGADLFFFTIPPRSDLVIAFWIVGRGNAANGYVFLNILQSLHNCFRAWNLRVGKMMFFVGRLPGGWYTLMDCNSLVSVYVKTKPSVKSFFCIPLHFLCWLGQETIPDDVKMIYNSKFLGQVQQCRIGWVALTGFDGESDCVLLWSTCKQVETNNKKWRGFRDVFFLPTY